ncbi:nickel transporter [Streptomyces boninensis]|uniref:HoxN/HupN/NixA family nickel/cobalt transporter n=1 Tax=Streptomyces boninensis TaxID=2039455 RepID=UPI003B21CA3B
MKSILPRSLPLAAGLLALAAMLAGAPEAAAHPLGNFTVSHYTGLTLHPDRIDAVAITDRAEIAAAQERPSVDRDHDGTITPDERAAHARNDCARLADGLRVRHDAKRVAWRTTGAHFRYVAGEAGLSTSRLECAFTGAADLARPTDIRVRTGYDFRRAGWHELTVRASGLDIAESDVAATSRTDQLRHYPKDPSADVLNQRSATVRTEPGPGTVPAPAPAARSAAGWFTAVPARAAETFDSLVGRRELTVPVGLLALLLAIVLGASHAAMPGHGKTIMAAYLAGRRGTRRDALTVGVTVTVTHTAGVLVLGLALPVATSLAGETVLTWLGMASGLLVTTIGGWLLRAALLKRPTHGHHHGPHPHPHPHGRGSHQDADAHWA